MISDEQALHFLATEGWLPLVLADHDGLVDAFRNLQIKAEEFFALPDVELGSNSVGNMEKSTGDADTKRRYQAVTGAQASEEGYSRIVNEKMILTLRSALHCPDILVNEVQTAWSLVGRFLASILQAIAVTLQLDENVFKDLVESCVTFTDARTPTLLRLFRYDRPPVGSDPKVNAEPHKDLGLLSLVVGHSPGLHVRQASSGTWIPVEDDSVLPAGAKTRSGGFTATLLAGQTLTYLTRGQYAAGAHGVACDPPSTSNGNDPFRYSLVFALRPAEVPLSTSLFESEIVGSFDQAQRIDNGNARDLFAKIKNAHYNVNAAPEIRDKQKADQKKAGVVAH